jgi:phosphatidylglycerol:prolipoprotein diacylglycerol transferase
MFPYIHVPDLPLLKEQVDVLGIHIGPIALHPFGLLVATGVIIGTYLATNRARKMGLDLERLNSFITWMLVAGFIGGHMLDDIFYHPDEIAKNPLRLIKLWEGLSSFGGFTGGLIGVLLWKYFEIVPGGVRKRARPQPVLPFCDVILSVFPVAWIFGRSGCSTVHDHPGALLSQVNDPLHGLLAVAYPTRYEMPDPNSFALVHGHAPRFDLGLLEMLFTCIIAACFAVTWHKKLPTGTYVAVVSLAYAPVRFVMDFIRLKAGDPDFPGATDLRYGVGIVQLTPAQWECMALFSLGIGMLFYIRSLQRRGIDPMDDVMAVKSEPSEPALAT